MTICSCVIALFVSTSFFASAMPLLAFSKSDLIMTAKLGDTAPVLENYSLIHVPPALAKSKSKANLNFNKEDKIEFQKGTVYVVEFWGTFCQPCHGTFPHLSALQKKYKDRVIVIGVSVDMPPMKDQVEAFVKDPSRKMEYRVIHDSTGAIIKNYMHAFESRSLPTAFIVDKKGKVVWFGHPGGLDKPLQKALR